MTQSFVINVIMNRSGSTRRRNELGEGLSWMQKTLRLLRLPHFTVADRGRALLDTDHTDVQTTRIWTACIFPQLRPCRASADSRSNHTNGAGDRASSVPAGPYSVLLPLIGTVIGDADADSSVTSIASAGPPTPGVRRMILVPGDSPRSGVPLSPPSM